MNNYSFQFAQAYQGYWCIPILGNDIPGILYIEKYGIHLDLFWNNTSMVVGKLELETATGYAYAKDESNKSCYYFTLNELFCTNASWFGNKQSQYKFDVVSFSISDVKDVVKDSIRNICIRTILLDKWVYDYTKSNFYYNIPSSNQETLKMEYTPKHSLVLCKTESMRVYISFGFGVTTPSYSGYSMTTRSFLNIEFKNVVSFDEAFNTSEHFIWLLTLLWNNMFFPDFVAFKTSESDFTYKQSNRYSRKYHDGENTTTITDITDFPINNFSSIIKKWITMIDLFNDPLSTFFETKYNGHMSSLSVIKNYISTIDGLSMDLQSPLNGQIIKGKQKQKIDNILTKIEKKLVELELCKDDFNKLKSAALRDNKKALKERFSCLLRAIDNYVECDLEQDFSEKVINTRNYYTHLKDKKDLSYSKSQFWDLTQCLDKIITAYILNTIGVESKTAKKIVRKIKMK